MMKMRPTRVIKNDILTEKALELRVGAVGAVGVVGGVATHERQPVVG
jgi:hypothetical protein